ncbi:hypothetical protein HYU95_02965 [Candidatus Daviesbacteria bacterium]|nr:hypothetical protein [Candidatus Daviesbacteria bacterium]
MKCPIDQTKMEEGVIAAVGMFAELKWSPKGSITGKLTGKPVTTYHCPKCGKIELTTDPEETK